MHERALRCAVLLWVMVGGAGGAQATFKEGSRTATRINFTLETPNDAMAKSYKLACQEDSDYKKWRTALEAAAQMQPIKEALPAPDRTNLVALVNCKSGGKQV